MEKDTPITELLISKRLKETLLKAGFKKFGEIFNVREGNTHAFEGIGKKTFDELNELFEIYERELEKGKYGKDTPITELLISKRLKGALLKAGFKKFGEFFNLREGNTYDFNAIGKKAFDELNELLAIYKIKLEENIKQNKIKVIQNEKIQSKKQVPSYPLNLNEFIEIQLSEREKSVIYNRIGLLGSKKTLEEIAEILNGVTRERVRQIEVKAVKEIKSAYELGMIVDPSIEKFKSQGDNMTFYSKIELNSRKYPKEILLQLLVKIFAEEYQFVSNINLGSEKILCKSNMQMETRLKGFFKELSESDSFININVLSEKYKIPVHIIRGIPKVSISANSVGLISNKKLYYQGIGGIIYSTLKEAGRPMKIKEICEKANLTNNQVRGTIERMTEAVNVGLSTYALREWGYIDGTISDVAVYFLKQADEPLRLKKLVRLILKQRIVKEGSVSAGLSHDERLVRLDNGYWALSEWGYKNIRQQNYQHREYEVDTKKVIMEVLDSNGGYMSLRQIFEEGKSRYGDKVSSIWVTYYSTIKKLKEEKKIMEIKKGRYSYYIATDS